MCIILQIFSMFAFLSFFFCIISPPPTHTHTKEDTFNMSPDYNQEEKLVLVSFLRRKQQYGELCLGPCIYFSCSLPSW